MLRFRARPGFALLLASLLLVAFVGIAAVALDFSRMYLFRTQLHTASDAAALAGALRLMNGDAQGASDTAIAYGTSHLVEKASATMVAADVVPGTWDFTSATFTPAPGANWFASENNAVEATARYVAPFTFGRFFGYTTRNRAATSIAALGSIGATDCVRPWAIPYESMLQLLYPGSTPPVTYDLTASDVTRLRSMTTANEILLKIGDGSTAPVPGAFYGVRLPPARYADGTAGNPGGGASRYRDAISAPCSELQQPVGTGDWLQAEQGNMEGPTRDGTAALCGIGGNPQSFTCSPPVPVKIALWDITDHSVASPNAFRVKYIGAFYVTGFSKGAGGSVDGVTGYFQSLVTLGSFNPEPGPLPKPALVR
jgi:hypothetical protein